MTLADLLQLLGFIVLGAGLYFSARKMPGEIRLAQATVGKVSADADLSVAQTIAAQNATIATLNQQVSALSKELHQAQSVTYSQAAEIATLTTRAISAETSLAAMAKMVNGFPEQIESLRAQIRERDAAARDQLDIRRADAQAKKDAAELALIEAGGVPTPVEEKKES